MRNAENAIMSNPSKISLAIVAKDSYGQICISIFHDKNPSETSLSYLMMWASYVILPVDHAVPGTAAAG